LSGAASKKIWALFTMSNLPEEILPRGDQAIDTYVRLMGLTPNIVHQVLPSRGFGLALTLAAEGERGYAGFIRLGGAAWRLSRWWRRHGTSLWRGRAPARR
jgi:hypothetical protein